MPEIVRSIEYYYTLVPNQAGAGAKTLSALKAEAVNLVAFNGFPVSLRRAQLVLVASDRNVLLAAAKKAGIRLVGPRHAFLIQGEDRVGAIVGVLNKLENAHINVTAIQAISSGEGHYGAVLWVKPRNIDKAAQALGAS